MANVTAFGAIRIAILIVIAGFELWCLFSKGTIDQCQLVGRLMAIGGITFWLLDVIEERDRNVNV
jgi:hypothetical protein